MSAASFFTYQKNPLYLHGETRQPRLFARLDLGGFGLEGLVPQLPIFYHEPAQPVGAIRVVYSTRVAGLPLETGNLQRLEQMIRGVLSALIRFERLPEYFFQVNGSAWPIYRLEDQLVTRYPGGPVFGAPNVTELRHWLADHFKATGRILNRKGLNLLYFSPFDLQLYAPICMLRTPDSKISDIPVFPYPGQNGAALRASLGFEAAIVQYHGGLGLLEIHQKIGRLLAAQGLATHHDDLTIRKLPAGAWERIKGALERQRGSLAYFRPENGRFIPNHLEVYIVNRMLYTARTNRFNRMTVYAGADIKTLQGRVGSDMHRYGAVASPSDVQVVTGALQRKNPSALDQVLNSPVFQKSKVGVEK